ncbi:MAG: sortase [Candidatus Nomurabacteria bacterium]|jgi:sortase (surface protein transpeptidase)|nr:sortase [Candidatus Nomurabacteria bacterium]
MLQIERKKVFSRENYKYLVVALAIAAAYFVVLQYIINGKLLADDKFTVDYRLSAGVAGERSDWNGQILSIPKLNIKASVFEMGVDWENRIEAPIVRSNIGVFMDKLLIGHNPGVFGELDELEIGDGFAVFGEGGVENYVVFGKEVKVLADISMKNEMEKGDLVLMTCYGELLNGDFTQRLIIYAKKLAKTLDA